MGDRSIITWPLGRKTALRLDAGGILCATAIFSNLANVIACGFNF